MVTIILQACIQRATALTTILQISCHVQKQSSGLFLPIRHIRLGLICPPGIRILFVLEYFAFKYTPSHDEVKISSLSRLRNHGLNIKCKLKLYSLTVYTNLISSSQSLNLGGRRATTDDVATILFHPSLSSVALRESPNPIPVHSLMLSSHLFCLPLFLAPFSVSCRTVFAMPEDLEMWPYHLSFRFFTMVRRSSRTPVAFWILLRTSSFVTWSL